MPDEGFISKTYFKNIQHTTQHQKPPNNPIKIWEGDQNRHFPKNTYRQTANSHMKRCSTSLLGKCKSKHNEVSLHTYQNGYDQKDKK